MVACFQDCGWVTEGTGGACFLHGVKKGVVSHGCRLKRFGFFVCLVDV